MTDIDWLAVFETKAELYHRRFGRLAPGKSDPLRDANDAENQERWERWQREGQYAIDAMIELYRSWREIERLRAALETIRETYNNSPINSWDMDDIAEVALSGYSDFAPAEAQAGEEE